MKIRNKIVFTFTGLVSFVMLFSFTLIYYLSKRFIERDFYDLVSEKATLTAWKYFEKDEMSDALYQKMIEKGAKILPEASETVLDTKQKARIHDSLAQIFPEDLVSDLLSGKNVQYRNHEKQAVGIYYPDNQGVFIVVVTAVNKLGSLEQRKLLELLVIIFLGSMIFIFLLGNLYATNVLFPIASILRNIKRIKATNLSLRLKENDRNDELSELATTFNQMLDRLENSFNVQRNFIHNASHELKNPLTAILGETEIALRKSRTNEEYTGALNRISYEAGRLDTLTRSLFSLAQTEFEMTGAKREEIRMDELIWEIRDHFEKTAYKGRIDIHYPELPGLPELITISGIPSLMMIAITNIMDNALKFSNENRVDVTLRTELKNIVIRVTDRGIGIPEHELANLFQPFSRATNAVAYKGSGIGLSLVSRIITLHNGTIQVSTSVGRGTTIEVKLPSI
ncbi:MAG: HAMP domain-containing sensor histidine kinase [Bacteroidota bacterium]